FQKGLMGHGAASAAQKGGCGEDEYQFTPPVRRDSNIDRWLIQLNSPFIDRLTIRPNTEDVDSGAHA
ncbi:MAG TPA: hypothetical protein VLE46_12185, partial [Nitrospira sp.]|nr:hypothetical protein [Nitrospira sp.]